MESGEPIQKSPKRMPFKRGIYILPSLFTVGSLVCGYVAILSTLKATGMDAEQGRFAFDTAAKLIGWAVLFDGLDGRIARLTNSSSDFGREFDSLADVITFGVAPAFLAYAWGVRPVEELFGTRLVQHLRDAGLVITFAFVICGAARLARFNVDTGKPASDKRSFVGLPIPAAAGVIAALIHCIKWPVNEWIWSLVWLPIVAVLAWLMVSKVRYPSFKSIDLRRRRPYVAIIFIGMVVYGMWTYSESVLLAIAMTYVLSGPVSRMISKIRPHPPAPPPLPQEVHAQ